ncbi:hypothetical protein [Mycolicibacterium sp. GF69]|nr:hypothetical protein [Mycolicibacterium sp. GF69]
MAGFLFAVMIAGLVMVGVVAQLGWQLPSAAGVWRGLERVWSRAVVTRRS